MNTHACIYEKMEVMEDLKEHQVGETSLFAQNRVATLCIPVSTCVCELNQSPGVRVKE